jgi:hypothetical protein
MTAADVLREFRRLLGEALVSLGDAAPAFTDEHLVEYIKGSLLGAEAVGVVTGYTLTEQNVGQPTYTFTIAPDPSSIDGLILATMSAAALLSGDLNARIRDGSLGVKFVTGLEEISTIEAGRRYTGALNDIQKHVRYLIVRKLSNGTEYASRVQ